LIFIYYIFSGIGFAKENIKKKIEKYIQIKTQKQGTKLSKENN